MPAAYDSYNYPSYWDSRKYEHEAEVFALTSFLKKIGKKLNILEIGAGFGRLTPHYIDHAKSVILSDPSKKLLDESRKRINSNKVKFIESSLEDVDDKLGRTDFDLVILIRVLHHIENTENCFKVIQKLVKPGGYFILEFANKVNFKANVRQLLRGDITYSFDLTPRSVGKKKKREELPFYNYHVDSIIYLLKKAGFTVKEKRSVSNIRNRFLKKILPHFLLINLEKVMQNFLTPFDFGPSIFILAKREH